MLKHRTASCCPTQPARFDQGTNYPVFTSPCKWTCLVLSDRNQLSSASHRHTLHQPNPLLIRTDCEERVWKKKYLCRGYKTKCLKTVSRMQSLFIPLECVFVFHCRYMQRRDQNGDPKQLQLNVDRTTTHAVKPQQSLLVLGLSGILDNTSNTEQQGLSTWFCKSFSHWFSLQRFQNILQ